jgi:formylglycine-generating enzyme required for sulfatase activity
MTNCGPGGSGTESCCASLDVAGGTYYRTYENVGDGGPTSEADPATVSGFGLDKYLVTVGRFRQYINYLTGGAGSPPASGSGIHTHLNGGRGLVDDGQLGDDGGVVYESGWNAAQWNAEIPTGPAAASTWSTNLNCSRLGYETWTPSPGNNENLPINCVNWYEAYAFCIWDGGFLPSEAEWGYAAAGGSQQREYPWGSTDPWLSVNQYAIFDCAYGNTLDLCTGPTNIAPVGTPALGAGYWGKLDMTGEVYEWSLDWLNPAYPNPCTDCAVFSYDGYPGRVLRGASFAGADGDLLAEIRSEAEPSVGAEFAGLRCARTP